MKTLLSWIWFIVLLPYIIWVDWFLNRKPYERQCTMNDAAHNFEREG